MPRTAAIALLVLTGVAASAPALSQESTIQPGYWEVKNRLSAVGGIVGKTETEKRCISPAEVQKFLMGPSNRHYKCEYPTRVFQNGKITLKGHCASKKGRQVQIVASGVYSPTSFRLTADVDTNYAGIPLGGRATTEARRLGDTCPANAKRG